MQRLRIDFASESATGGHSMDVPDMATALVVADINMERGVARIHDGERLLATLEKQGRASAPYWRVS